MTGAFARELPGLVLPGSQRWHSAVGDQVVVDDGNVHARPEDGRIHLTDLTTGFGAHLYGHNAVLEDVRRMLSSPVDLPTGLGDIYTSEPRMFATHELTSWASDHWAPRESDGLAPGARLAADELRAVVLQSGSEAVETAIKTALLASGRTQVVAFAGGYHGTYGLALAVTHRPAFREPFAEQYAPGAVRFAPWGEVPRLDERTACVIVEPIQGRAGVLVPPPSFLPGLRAECDRVGAFLIVDSVLVGAGRAGEPLLGGACAPDVMALGKAIGGGLPVGVTIARRDVAEAAWNGPLATATGEAIHTSTFVGHPLTSLAVQAALLRLGRADISGASTAWAAWASAVEQRTGLVARGRGLLWALETGQPGGGVTLAKGLLSEGFIVAPSGETGSSVTLTPSLVTGDAMRAALLDAIAAVVRR